MSALTGLETKTGVLLGLAAVLVALAAVWESTWARALSAVPAALAAVVCLIGLLTRPVEALDLKTTRDKYLTADPQQTAFVLLDTINTNDKLIMGALRSLRRTVNGALILLAMSTAVNVVLVIATTPR